MLTHTYDTGLRRAQARILKERVLDDPDTKFPSKTLKPHIRKSNKTSLQYQVIVPQTKTKLLTHKWEYSLCR